MCCGLGCDLCLVVWPFNQAVLWITNDIMGRYPLQCPPSVSVRSTWGWVSISFLFVTLSIVFWCKESLRWRIHCLWNMFIWLLLWSNVFWNHTCNSCYKVLSTYKHIFWVVISSRIFISMMLLKNGRVDTLSFYIPQIVFLEKFYQMLGHSGFSKQIACLSLSFLFFPLNTDETDLRLSVIL